MTEVHLIIYALTGVMCAIVLTEAFRVDNDVRAYELVIILLVSLVPIVNILLTVYSVSVIMENRYKNNGKVLFKKRGT